MIECPHCQHEVLEIDVKCSQCGGALGATGAHRMIGQVMLGQYELVDVLGQGGMSVVFKGRHKLTEQEVALKILPPELAAHSQVKSRFLEEAKALAALDHPNIVHLYNFGQENGYFVLAMQFVQGKTWERMILEAKRLDWKATCRVAVDVLKALEYAHGRGVVHRDMKPSNVLVRAHDAMATVMDFGIAKMTTSTKLTATGQTMGTVRYMSPEQVRGQEVDLRTDLYSLGATMYESLVGDTPFDGNTHFEIMTKHLSELPKRPSAAGAELPAAVEDAIMRSLAKKPEDRFDSARSMRKQLESVLREEDLGLVETQKLNREVLGDLRPTQPDRPPRPVSAADLANELEPSASDAAHPAARKKRALPWILAGIVAVAGGATAVVLATRGTDAPAAYTPAVSIKGVTLTGGARAGHILVETAGGVAPADLAARYEAMLGELRAFTDKALPGFDVSEPVQELVAVPRSALCEPSAYVDGQPPSDCATALAEAMYGPKSTRRLLVVDDPALLSASLHYGLYQALCVFQPDADPKRQKDVCEKLRTFAAVN
ncbi:MAG TPA: serine/threonine-protein kinase [Kofleriaceae bacterium]|jgi:serine/threonine protein kinase